MSRSLFDVPGSVAHLGLDTIVQGAEAAGVPVRRIPFAPPAGGDPGRIQALQFLLSPPRGPEIDAANRVALERFLASRPMLIGVGRAIDTIPGMAPDRFLHAGPPISWDRMSGPLSGAVIGGMLLEGLASNPEDAARVAASGRVRFEPCHHHQAVGPMAGLVTPSMPVWILEDSDGPGKGHRTFCTLNEGLGKVLRYGAYGEEVLARMRSMAAELAPTQIGRAHV